MQEAQNIFNRIQKKISELPVNELYLSANEENLLRSQKIDKILEHETAELPVSLRLRIYSEFESYGPLDQLMADPSITEILVNGPLAIWYEKQGCLHFLEDRFLSDISFRNCIDRISQESQAHLSVENPAVDGSFKDFRVSMIGAELSRSGCHLALRRHPKNPWTFEKLREQGWCDEAQLQFLKSLMAGKKNFLVIGQTGSGKTSILNSFLQGLDANERVVVIEDTQEISLPNTASMRLLTRDDAQGVLSSIDQGQLVKRALRLRPDRIVMGEVRGGEAKDFLMALATGHQGSFGSLHAKNPAQALIRLEMLIQMGAPQWSLLAIRRLIHLSLDYIVVTGKKDTGSRFYAGAYRLSSLEDHGFLVEPVGP